MAIRSLLEIVACRTAIWLVPLLPRRMVVVAARFLGRLASLFARHLRHVAMANLDLAFGDELSLRRKRRILRESFQTFALTLADMFWFRRNTRRRLGKYVTLDDSLLKQLSKGPLICVTAHIGNWEVMGMAVAAAGYPLVSVAATIANPAVDRLLTAFRTQTGQVIVPRKGAVRHLLRALRDGHRIALVLDQNTKPSEGGVFVDFFGKPVPVSNAAALLALQTGTPIICGYCFADLHSGSYHAAVAHVFNPADLNTSDRYATALILTQKLTASIERQVRLHPGNWMWTYKRWKHLPPDATRSEYPFYAKPPPPPPSS